MYSISFEALKKRVKKVISSRIRDGWKQYSPPYYSWQGAFAVLPEVISRAIEEPERFTQGRNDGREHKLLDECNKMLGEMEDAAYAIVARWDVREAQKLVELFPETLATKYQKARFTADMDEKGDWYLYTERRV